MKEKKLRVEDALHATRAAVEEGILPGGGVALLRASKALDKLKGSDQDEKTGIDIILRAVEAPIVQIARNSGVEGAIVVDKVLESMDVNFGFNADTLEYGDLVKGGVIDPTNVVRCALENADHADRAEFRRGRGDRRGQGAGVERRQLRLQCGHAGVRGPGQRGRHRSDECRSLCPGERGSCRSRGIPAWKGRSSWTRCWSRKTSASASMRTRWSTRTWSKGASSIRRMSFAVPWRTRIMQIARNSGVEGAIVVDKVLESKDVS